MNRTQILRRGGPYITGAGLGLIMLYWRAQEYLAAIAMVLAITGMNLNVLVCSANGWRMPVRNRVVDTERHMTLRPEHRFPYLADILPVGVVVLSLGDALVAVAWVFFVVGVFLR
jgi:hypothetical protein